MLKGGITEKKMGILFGGMKGSSYICSYMAKSHKPVGVRFDLDLLRALAEDGLAKTPQQALNYLSEFYRLNRVKIDFKKMFEESALVRRELSKDLLATGMAVFKTENDGIKRIDPISEEAAKVSILAKIEEHQAELGKLGVGRIADQRRGWLNSQIFKLKKQLL